MGRPRKSVGRGSKRHASSPGEREHEENAKVSKRLKKEAPSSAVSIHQIHEFSEEDGRAFTSSLVKWYSENKRDLPWRTLSKSLSPTDRAYSVLVSEVMLQQTQVVTVIPYYTKWISRWPTFSHLAQASLNEVNEVWAGMGYYSRAKRLWEAAKKVHEELDAQVPLTSGELQEKLPGVGRYTAGAVASIAFGEKVAAVDGNVVRVLSRARCIGADQTSKVVLDHIWKLSEQLVPIDEPGNYNQAMMDLGATICTPKKPSCKSCPVSHVCFAYQRTQRANPLKELQVESSKPALEDIENVPCSLCLKQPWDAELGVMNFPQKAKKAPPRKEVTLVCIFHASAGDKDEYLLTKRPQGGLLAGLWEFPNVLFGSDRNEPEEKKELVKTLLKKQWGASDIPTQPQFIGEVPHIFSHIHQLYVVFSLKLSKKTDVSNKSTTETMWMNSDEILSSAISTAMKKVFKEFTNSHQKGSLDNSGKGRSKSKKSSVDTTSKKVSDFFKRVEK